MGRKRARAGQFIFLCIAGLISCFLCSCAAWEGQCVLTREVYIEKAPRFIEKAPPKAEYPNPLGESLGQAEQLLKQGDFEASLKENQRVLSISGKNPPGDRALFNMGLIYADRENPKKDCEKALLFFSKVLKDYSQSPLAEEAKIWVGLLRERIEVLQENEKLKKVIENLKQVDIEVEEKKREKAR
jgi:tetratricopeptide (TPR) repeat protein